MADATSRPMKVPVTYIPYVEKYRVYEMFQAKDESNGTKSISSQRNTFLDEGINITIGTERSERESAGEDVLGELKEIEIVQKSIDYHMDEKLASMTEDEFKKFSEEVICNWRTIRRSNKFFNVRELSAYQHQQDERRYSEGSDTETDEDNNGDNSITLIFHTKESNNEITKGSSQIQMEGSVNDSGLKMNQSIRSLDIKIKMEETVPSDASIINSIGDEILTVSYVEPENEAIMDKEGSNEQIIQVKLLQGIPFSDSIEIKDYIMKLIQEMVEKIISELPKQSLPNINLSFFQLPKKSKKIHFPRGPVMIPRVVLLGPPGSGKNLQAKLLAKALKLIHVDMVLLILAWHSRLGKIEKGELIRKYSLTGEQMMNESSTSILQERLLREDCLKNGWILTGYPVTAAHASALDNIKTPPNRIIYLDKPLEKCRELIATRLYDVDTGEVAFVQPELPERQGMSSRPTELMPEIENIVDIFGIEASQLDILSGYVVELGQGIGKGHELFHNILECVQHRKRLLRSPEDDPKFVDLRFKCHAAFKNELLKYYGGWCTKLNIGSQSSRRVHEAILSVVKGPFPSFEEAVIGDRSTRSRYHSIFKLGGQIEAKLKIEMIKFFSNNKIK